MNGFWQFETRVDSLCKRFLHRCFLTLKLSYLIIPKNLFLVIVCKTTAHSRDLPHKLSQGSCVLLSRLEQQPNL